MPGKKLLFVDDEPAIRVTMPMILQQEGFEVTTAATVPEALEYINKEQFDVLLSDLNIGEPGDGFTVVSAMRRTHPETITLILTGYPDFETALQALRSQVDDYLTKPADLKQLIATLRERLKSPRRIAPVQVKRVSTVLRENAEVIIEQWFQAVGRDREMTRITMSKKERIDHLPAILKELADQVDTQRFDAADEALQAARKHGAQRRAQGYKARQIVLEARILHTVISNTLHAHLLFIDMSTLISDLMHMGEALHQQLEESVRSFEEAPSRLSA